MIWMPQAKTRQAVKFWLDSLQVLTVVGSIFAIAIAYISYRSSREAELKRPFNEKQLELYAEATRVAAHIATNATLDKETETRFWELYWGQLPFVELPNVAKAMNEFCLSAFQNHDKCSKDIGEKTGLTIQEINAVKLSNTASTEIQNKWLQDEPHLLGYLVAALQHGLSFGSWGKP